MSRFRSQFKRSAAPGLLRQFGETVTYYAGGVGEGREIQAIIERSKQVIAESGNLAYMVLIQVLDDATLGISSDEFDEGVDTIKFPYYFGETPVERQVTRVPSTSTGMLRFGVQ